MVVITGGAFQGKLEFAKELFTRQGSREPICVDGTTFVRSELTTDREGNGVCPESVDIIYNLHGWIAELIREERAPYGEVKSVIEKNQNVILVVNELGCGIVPVDPFDRQWRETCGRVCCELCREAEAVFRVICGIGSRIK